MDIMKRSAQSSLGQIVLGAELIVVALAALTVFGLGALPPEQALGGGAALCVFMVITIALMRKYRFAFVLGWIVQFIVVASGFLVTMLFLIGTLFTALYAYGMIQGAKVDSHKKDNL
jgi:hypothetical protein